MIKSIYAKIKEDDADDFSDEEKEECYQPPKKRRATPSPSGASKRVETKFFYNSTHMKVGFL